MKKENLQGLKFGRLTVVSEAPKVVRKSGTIIRWHCKCECGNETIATSRDLKRGHSRSCGCYQRQRTSEESIKHGMRNERIYHIWLNMKNRCNNPKYKRYSDYGGRGISVCEEWQCDFLSFFNCVSNLPHYGENGFTLDRKDNSRGYEPNNVRWATVTEQNLNRRNTKKVTWNGEEMTLIQAERVFGIKYSTLLFHHKRGDLPEYLKRRQK